MAIVSRKKVDTSQERNILIGMIVSDQFLRSIIPIYKADLLEIAYAPIVANWCIEHYSKFQKAPRELIQDLFKTWSKQSPKDDQIKFIEGFLGTLSEEYTHADKFNADYMLEKAVLHFKKRSLENLAEDIKYFLDNGDIESAESSRVRYREVELEDQYKAVDPFADENAIRNAFEAKQDPLFTLPGELGNMMNGQLTRDGFISLLAPEKRGKSWLLMYIAMVAYKQRCNVAFFSAGDMSQNDMIRRMLISLTGRSDMQKYCNAIYRPVLDCELNQRDTCERVKRVCNMGCYDGDEKLPYADLPQYTPCTECIDDKNTPYKGAVWGELRRAVRPLSWQEANTAAQAYRRKHRVKEFKMETYPNDTLTVSMIRAKLDEWEREGWIADVVVCDYFDILDVEQMQGDQRAQENKKWKRGRKLSQEKHICLVTATQADAASYYVKNLTKANFSEDKRKMAHVTGFYALNQTADEKKIGIMRVGTLVAREDKYDEDHQVHILQCLEAGEVYRDSY